MKRPLYNAIYSLFFNPKHFVAATLYRIGGFIPDKLYLEWIYYLECGHRINWDNPQRYNEKLQWIKLFDHNPLYTELADKYAVKKIVSEKLGEEYVAKCLGVWDRAEDIDWDKLPDRFVLKTAHDGGNNGVFIVRDKAKANKSKIIRGVNKSLHRNTFVLGREWPYKDIPRRVFAEEYLEDANGELRDYKFFCFNGRVKCFKIDYNRQVYHQANYYDPQCHLLPYGEAAYPPNYEADIHMPENIQVMIALAEKLAKDIPFVRIDFYNVDGKIYFGEITFYPAGGMSKWVGEVPVDEIWGEWLRLPDL